MDVGNDREIIEILTEVRSGQKYLTASIDEFKKEMNEFKKEMNEFKKEIREKVDSHGDELKDVKSDIRYLKDTTRDNCSNIKQLQDERTVNIMQMSKQQVPGIIKYGVVAFIVISLFTAISTFSIYQDIAKKAIQNNQVQIQP